MVCAWALCAQLLGVDDARNNTAEHVVDKHREDYRRRLSVRVNTFRRDDLLGKFLEHYAPCSAVGEIVVVWSDVARRPPAWLLDETSSSSKTTNDFSGKVRVETHSTDSLNNRFKPLETPRHFAVLSIDDDVFVSCHAARAMLDAWALAGGRQMVGLAPRLVSPRDFSGLRGRNLRRLRRRRQSRQKIDDANAAPAETRALGDSASAFSYAYHRWWHVWWNGAYSLVLTKVAVFHRDYLDAYSDPASRVMTRVRDHVHRHRNCEDIAMSFIVANATHAPPVWLRAPYADYGQSFQKNAGISSQGDHIQIREECLALFAHLFGRMPLVTGYQKLIPAKSAWFW